MMSKFTLIFLGCCLAATGAMAVAVIETEEQIWSFMNKYGYIKGNDMVDGLPKDEDTRRNSILLFQKMGNMSMTGVLDEESMNLMNTPRCGMKDINSLADVMRKKRFSAQARWERTDLTWNILSQNEDLPPQQVESIMERAFRVWSDVSSLTFNKVFSTEPDIKIIFARGEHGDASRFDGPNGVLAHAYFPTSSSIGGDAHFDEDERYTDGTFSGTNLFQVAAHEYGHSLGLGHSDHQDALMYPYYRGYQPNFQLHEDDIAGIQYLYGEGDKSPEESVTPSTPFDGSMNHFSFVTQTADGSTYFANETHLFRRGNDGVLAGYPKKISDEFPGLPNDLDAALFSGGYMFFFKGSQFWAFRNQEYSFGGPISDLGEGIPDNMDSVFQWGRNGNIYFTKGGQYYRYYPDGIRRYYYPRPLSNWAGLPSDGVDAAFTYSNGFTYFFKGSDYYRFNNDAIRVDDGYPKNSAINWFGYDPNANVLVPTTDTEGDATVMIPSTVAILFSAIYALFYAF